jgi:magnesium transporter
MAFTAYDKPWEDLRSVLDSGDTENITKFLESLRPSDTALAISRLTPVEQGRLLSLLNPSFAADVIEDVPDSQAADIIEELPPKQAAAIVDEMQSDRQADLLSELEIEDIEAILQEMTPSDAEEARSILSYPADSAGGIMISEFFAYRENLSITDVLEDLQKNREIYMDYHVQYIYIVDREGKLSGVLRMHDLLFAPRSSSLDRVMIGNPIYVKTEDRLEDLRCPARWERLPRNRQLASS